MKQAQPEREHNPLELHAHVDPDKCFPFLDYIYTCLAACALRAFGFVSRSRPVLSLFMYRMFLMFCDRLLTLRFEYLLTCHQAIASSEVLPANFPIADDARVDEESHTNRTSRRGWDRRYL